MKLENFIGQFFGLLLLTSAFVPIGAYHSRGNVGITGTLWNFMLPTGWFGMVACVGLFIQRRIGLKKKGLAYAMFSISLLLVMLLFLIDVDYFLSLWHGIKPADFDVDYLLMTPVSLSLAILGVFMSLLLMTTHKK